MKGYIPSNLNLESEKHRDKLYYLITLIYYSRIFDKRKTKDTYVTLNGKLLHKILGGYYIKYIRWLIDFGIIESDRNYIPKKKSIGYRLTQKYRAVKFRRIEITNKKLCAKIEQAKNSRLENYSIETYQYLIHCLQNVETDFAGAYKWIEQNETQFPKFDFSTYTCSIDLLHSKDYYFTSSSLSGRVFTNITQLPKDLRPFLSYDSKKLVEIDLANSQPFFLNFLIPDYLSKKYPNSNLINVSNYLSYDTKNIFPEDAKKFIELTSDGTFYKYLIKAFNFNGTEKQFKKILFARVFYNDNDKSEYEEWYLFRDLFPTVAEVISFHKKDDYKKFSHMLQKAEADIMINKIVPKLMSEEIYVLTIHDSILTTPDNSERVKKIMLDEFKNQYGLVPTIRNK